ncbi:DUF2798 domain-containing protein [Shewanella psychrophila]|uniref:DUF2798 domain-containing protein n=1 Tax=Shewanella psychrophila TaxID=225848 RepID=UPI001F4811FE|nr:DUF2798 domain-containing protein [Shewanella psychrophila]
MMKQPMIFSLLMSFVLSLLMTLWITWINLGLPANFLWLWAKAFMLAWPAAACISFLFAPKVHQLTEKIVSKWL